MCPCLHLFAVANMVTVLQTSALFYRPSGLVAGLLPSTTASIPALEFFSTQKCSNSPTWRRPALSERALGGQRRSLELSCVTDVY